MAAKITKTAAHLRAAAIHSYAEFPERFDDIMAQLVLVDPEAAETLTDAFLLRITETEMKDES